MRRLIATRWLFTLMLLTILVPVGLHASATIVIQNNDGAGEGFNDPAVFTPIGGNTATTLGQARLIAFTYAANLWGECINSPVTITIRAQMDPLTCTPTSATLGSAGAMTVHRDFTGAPVASTWYSQALANSLNGADLDPATPDINATFNSSINGNAGCLGGGSWYYGLDGNPGPNQWDFVTVVCHEIGHGLGFQTFVGQNGARFMGFNDQFMRFMESAGASPSMYTAMNDAQRGTANLSDPNLRWTGASANAQHPNIPITAGLNGGLLRLHGPNPFQPGSSLSHWSTALSPNELMEPVYTAPDHNMSLALYLMQDIGWSIDSSPPVLTCPTDADIECSETGGTSASDGNVIAWLASVSAAGGCGEVVIVNDAPSFFAHGSTTTVNFTATDGAINAVSCSAKITIVDTTDPAIDTCPGDQEVECSSPCGVPKSELQAWLDTFAASDYCDPSVSLTNDAPNCFPEGETTVTFTATDDDLNSSTCTAKVKVVDTTPPEIDVVLDRDVLWPPNHKLVEVCAEVTVTDVCDDNPTFVLVSITSDEPDNGKGDGNTVDDIQNEATGTPDLCYDLRSERQGGGEGRTYTILYRASDGSGNTTDATVCVRVPHDHSSGAFASSGFTLDGASLENGVDRFVIIVPSSDGVEAAFLELKDIFLGNTRGVSRPVERRVVDINADQRLDLALYFDAAEAPMLTEAAAVMTFGDDGTEGSISKAPGDGPLGLHFVTPDGVDYLIGNVFGLGTRVAMPVGTVVDEPPPLAGTPPPSPTAKRVTEFSSIHPNPFNPETTVDFALSSGERVRIAVYDVRGSLVKMLVDQTLPAGEHHATWNGIDNQGRPATSGIYFVRMIAGRYEQTRKIVMLK